MNLLALAIAAFPATAAFSAAAAPFVPASDAVVLERLRDRPTDPAARELRTLRTALAERPNDLALALATARRYVEEARASADPRYLGRAEAALSPWLALSEPPVEVLVMRATLKQSVHDFSGALADLARALERDPNNPQAWLIRATVLQVQGDYAGARRACQPLRRLADRPVAVACTASAASLNGQGAAGYRLLQDAYSADSGGDPGTRVWIATLLAETAERLGDAAAAETHFKEAFGLTAPDGYLKGAYADFLLDRGRAGEVAALLKDDIRADPLLLRLALAEKALASPALAGHVAGLAARFDAARRRGDTVHRREEARFRLHLQGDAPGALALAEQNWAVQREPADARILLEAARAAGAPARAAPVLDWMKANRVEDARLARLATTLGSAR